MQNHNHRHTQRKYMHEVSGGFEDDGICQLNATGVAVGFDASFFQRWAMLDPQLSIVEKRLCGILFRSLQSPWSGALGRFVGGVTIEMVLMLCNLLARDRYV